ncbi:MAG: lytic transglycosylase domain-containing protein [Deltaproteobacteria bacterium]|nr:lytic transglycosylase domain-containing protein [Deltaproteobacteria bacterium]
MPVLLGVLTLASAIAPAVGTAGPDADNPYIIAASRENVPRELLIAIAGAESGFHPWALNIAGREVYCSSRQEAERLPTRTDNVDIGLMQINWPAWGRRFGLTKSELLDPRTNLLYGARILRRDLARTGNIWLGISDYHAGSLQRRDRYNKLVYRHYLHYLRGEFDR